VARESSTRREGEVAGCSKSSGGIMGLGDLEGHSTHHPKGLSAKIANTKVVYYLETSDQHVLHCLIAVVCLLSMRNMTLCPSTCVVIALFTVKSGA
jgi:hypothetical protein